MNWISGHLWVIPLLPLLAAAVIAGLPRRDRRAAMGLSIGTMAGALGLSVLAFLETLGWPGGSRVVTNFDWFPLGTGMVRLGFVLDPLAAVMLVMVSLVGLAIFVFSAGYMAGDENLARFFGFLSLFAAAMLGLVMANSLLLLFACWEVMGLASYLLIGFWFQRPAAAAAAQKAFIVTRIGDLGLFLGMLWLYGGAGTLLFYDDGAGCLEGAAVAGLTAQTLAGALTVGGAISLLLFVGAIGKSGQVPLHVWLPDAMEGPTPVSALIHAATMVAAGVFLVARMHPLMAAGAGGEGADEGNLVMGVVAWVGAVTAFFAAMLAVAQSDIKRVLAYSTVSQLGFMFLGLGTGGVAVGMFHLITHAFFKSLLFLGAGSVIHGCHHEQDIRRMGGLRKSMPWTFGTYAVGMMALAGVPFFFSGFWSKDEILHAAWESGLGRGPFLLGLAGALLTAFYMTRQMAEVFFGRYRGGDGHGHGETGSLVEPRESPRVMTIPLGVLAVFAVVLGWVWTPAWPWFEGYLAGQAVHFEADRWAAALPMMLVSAGVVAVGMGLGWWWYGRCPRVAADLPDPLEVFLPRAFRGLRERLYVDELYEATVVRLHRGWAAFSGWLDRLVIQGTVVGTGWIFRGLAEVMRWADELLVNPGFDAGCWAVRRLAAGFSWVQSGRVQAYLTGLGLGMVGLSLLLLWGWWMG